MQLRSTTVKPQSFWVQRCGHTPHGYTQFAVTLPVVVPASLLPHLRNARDLADRQFRSPLDLDALAGAAHVSKYHFARCFSETYGETPMRYLTRRRIERAQDLLRSANLTVTEVCMMVGFTSLGSFSSRFRDLVGETPTQYRDRWAERGGPRIPGCFLFMRGIDGWPDGQPAQESNLGEASAPADP
jgi:AraC-like DNA-binding protein